MLLLTGGAFYYYDSLFGQDGRNVDHAVAEIVRGKGDMRVRYKNELHWQKAHTNQKLIYDDAVFAGDDSKVELKVGQSDLTLDSNTLIVLRKKDLFNTLNLNYGGMQGMLAKGDHLVIESNGERVELSAQQTSKVVISSKNEKMTIQVKSGAARMVNNGEVKELTVHDMPVVLDTKPRAAKAEPLRLLAPERIYFYSEQDRRSVNISWGYVSGRSVKAEDEFTLEVSPGADFLRLEAKEPVSGQHTAAISLAVPGNYFYRVRDSRGNVSPPRNLVFAKPVPPQIESPAHDSVLDMADGETPLRVLTRLQPLAPGSRAHIQIARDPAFTQLVLDRPTTVPEAVSDLSAGDYYVRAKAMFDADKIESAWSNASFFTVREPLDLNRMARQGMPYEIVIPNENYPRELYRNPTAARQAVQKLKPFQEFFAGYLRKGYDLVTGLRDQPASERKQTEAQFPAAWIEPGRIDVTYRIEARGVEITKPTVHRLRVRMAPPKDLRANSSGQMRWSPILFAAAYEGELRDDQGHTEGFTSRSSVHLEPVEAGRRYTYRVRALGASGSPISDWSEPGSFQTPAPVLEEPPPPVQTLADKPPEEPRREPAAEEGSNRIRLDGDGERSVWERLGAWLWAGSGFNFVMVKQTIASTADVQYHNTKGPSAYLEAGYMGEKLGGAVAYKRTPGDIRVDNYPVDRRDFVWSTYTAEGLFRLPWKGTVLGYPISWFLRGGVQYHEFPFLFVGTGRSLRQASNNMSMASLGFSAETLGRLKYHWTMRYQQPFKSSSEGGNEFSLSPITAFDGSLGASYLLGAHWKTGVFWYGQLHNYKFNYRSLVETNVGEQWLFYSNAEVRMGYDF